MRDALQAFGSDGADPHVMRSTPPGSSPPPAPAPRPMSHSSIPAAARPGGSTGSRRLDTLRSPGARQAMRFAVVGVGSTALYTALFAVLDTRLNHHVANVLALLVCTVLNTSANQRFTFDAAGHERGRTAHVQSLAILGVTLAVTTAALVVEHHVWPGASTLWDTVTVTTANAIATVARFVILRRIFAG